MPASALEIAALSPWDFEKDGRNLTVKPGRGPIFNDSDLMVAAATEGYGVAYILEDIVSRQIASGALVRVLEEWCEPFAGYYLYYPSADSKRPPSHTSRMRCGTWFR